MNSGTAKQFTVPLNSSQAFDIGTQILIARQGSGEVNVAGEAGVTVNSASSFTKLNSVYSGATLVKVDTNVWYLFGDLKA